MNFVGGGSRPARRTGRKTGIDRISAATQPGGSGTRPYESLAARQIIAK
jgi:hypothetical protein